MHVLLAAEDRSVVPAEASERRYVVLHINDKYAQQKPTSNLFFDEMAHGGHAAMLYDLLRRSPYSTPI
jgi:hypothetical protein